MKKLKYVFWLILIAFLALLVFQNLAFFSEKNSLHIDLGLYQKTTPPWTNGAIIAGFVGLGVFIMLIFYFSSRFGIYKANKTIKELRNTLDSRTKDLSDLKSQLASLKSGLHPSEETPAGSEVAPEPAASQEDSEPQS